MTQFTQCTQRKNSSLPHFQLLCQMVKLFFQGPKSSEKTLKILKNTERIQPNTFTFNLHTFCMNQGQGLFVSIVHISTQKD